MRPGRNPDPDWVRVRRAWIQDTDSDTDSRTRNHTPAKPGFGSGPGLPPGLQSGLHPSDYERIISGPLPSIFRRFRLSSLRDRLIEYQLRLG